MGWSESLWWQQGEGMPCPLRQVDLAARSDGHLAAVDNTAHQLWHAGRIFPCDRDIEALSLWQGHALTLSSDTDCLSIADKDGWLVTAKAGMYPQDMAIRDDEVYVCGGADGQLHVLSLPELQTLTVYPLPGMPERITLDGDAAWLLCLAADDDALQTLLHHLSLRTGKVREAIRLSGLPGALLAGPTGLWAAVSERLYHFPRGQDVPDTVLDGFGLIRHIAAHREGVLVTDPVAGLSALVVDGAIRSVQRFGESQADLSSSSSPSSSSSSP